MNLVKIINYLNLLSMKYILSFILVTFLMPIDSHNIN